MANIFFKMFPKQAIARLLYKLGRMEGSLDAMQEEEQNGFRQGKQGEQGERASLHCHVNVCLKKSSPQMHDFGSSTWVFPKLIAMHHGLR